MTICLPTKASSLPPLPYVITAIITNYPIINITTTPVLERTSCSPRLLILETSTPSSCSRLAFSLAAWKPCPSSPHSLGVRTSSEGEGKRREAEKRVIPNTRPSGLHGGASTPRGWDQPGFSPHPFLSTGPSTSMRKDPKDNWVWFSPNQLDMPLQALMSPKQAVIPQVALIL